jgi:hypothetical protein
VRWICFHVILKVLTGKRTICTGVAGPKIS